MTERAAAITLKGNPMTLVGPEIQVGQPAPDFTLRGQDLGEIKLSDFRGKVLVLVTVPSLDTPVCDTEVRRFNQDASGLGDDVVILTVSVDLPMAQKRWCGAAGVERVVTGSDYLDHSFGSTYGLRIKEVGLIARAVIVVDREGVVQHYQLVPEVADEPNYETALQAARDLA